MKGYVRRHDAARTLSSAKSLLIRIGLAILQQVTGINAIICANEILASAGFATAAG